MNLCAQTAKETEHAAIATGIVSHYHTVLPMKI